MNRLSFNRCAGLLFALTLLSGCGGQSAGTLPVGAGNVLAQHGKTSGAPLLYATSACDGTCILTYPGLKLIGSIPDNGASICSDSEGNIFLPKDSQVVEYAHGGTAPLATLSIPGSRADGCSVDPLTNNLAVVFQAQVAVYQNEQGTPTVFPTHIDAFHCTYDASGNLFVAGYGGNSGADYALAELASGASDFTTISLSNSVGGPGQIQWDGQYLAYQSFSKYGRVYRLQIIGSSATIVSTISFKSVRHGVTQAWLYGGQIMFAYNIHGSRANVISTWHYPKGGKATNTIRKWDGQKKREIDFQGVTISVPTSQ